MVSDARARATSTGPVSRPARGPQPCSLPVITGPSSTLPMVHHGQVFDGLATRGEPLNCVVPDRIPNGSTGTIPVVARLVWEDGEEWWPC